ncbi:hypothetical protein [Pluralibacter sp.]|uniref:hypothetical protein n=1 Tax=Pluralibacter sp. TaxID=1920032 RepID=UPI0025DA1694|nr:hypothetical protein [Pluralibacter sp.]MBV8042816.1 hypothetical protein [Pluralibacter sp.]
MFLNNITRAQGHVSGECTGQIATAWSYVVASLDIQAILSSSTGNPAWMHQIPHD